MATGYFLPALGPGSQLWLWRAALQLLPAAGQLCGAGAARAGFWAADDNKVDSYAATCGGRCGRLCVRAPLAGPHAPAAHWRGRVSARAGGWRALCAFALLSHCALRAGGHGRRHGAGAAAVALLGGAFTAGKRAATRPVADGCVGGGHDAGAQHYGALCGARCGNLYRAAGFDRAQAACAAIRGRCVCTGAGAGSLLLAASDYGSWRHTCRRIHAERRHCPAQLCAPAQRDYPAHMGASICR